jgi:hypothetical protein
MHYPVTPAGKGFICHFSFSTFSFSFSHKHENKGDIKKKRKMGVRKRGKKDALGISAWGVQGMDIEMAISHYRLLEISI